MPLVLRRPNGVGYATLRGMEALMKAGMFLMPSHPPERDTFEAHQWDLDCIAYGDELGYTEAWIGEHFTAPWEPVQAPDLLIAQALMRTTRIKLGVGVHLLPFHHPVELATRAAYLDHMAQGRYMFGIGSGGLPTDMQIFGVDAQAGEHQARTRECLEIILKLWESPEPFEYKGEFWSVTVPDPAEWEFAALRNFRVPFQKPHPPIAMASSSLTASTLKLAGARGFLPMSFTFNRAGLVNHWAAVEEGARSAGRPQPSRSQWRIVRDVWIADTDAEAREGVLNGMLARAHREYLLPVYKFGPTPLIEGLKQDPETPNDAITPEYLADNVWLVGSPETVTRKLRDLYEMAGGFGILLMMVVDHWQQNEAWRKSMRLLAEEVLPALSDLTGD